MSANTMTKRVSSVKSSPTLTKNLRTSREEELRLYISFDELKSMEGTGSGVATGCSRQEETKLKEQGIVRESEGRAQNWRGTPRIKGVLYNKQHSGNSLLQPRQPMAPSTFN